MRLAGGLDTTTVGDVVRSNPSYSAHDPGFQSPNSFSTSWQFYSRSSVQPTFAGFLFIISSASNKMTDFHHNEGILEANVSHFTRVGLGLINN